MGDSILLTVKCAARLAVYDEMMIRVKNHQKLATIRDDTALKNQGISKGVYTCYFETIYRDQASEDHFT